MDLKPYIHKLRNQIEYSLRSDEFGLKDMMIKNIDDYLSSEVTSDLEKAFFLVLNQFPADNSDYIIIPNEMILLEDVYDMGTPGIEYEIDFAIYGGSVKDPVKVAVEIDGQRSHGQKHVRKDRRKDVNLQAAGWLVMRFTSKEVHEEIIKFSEHDNHVSDFLISIENVIRQKLDLVTGNNYARPEVRSLLTGYHWGYVQCTNCGHRQIAVLNRKKHTCKHCKEKFVRQVESHERIAYEHNGLYYFL